RLAAWLWEHGTVTTPEDEVAAGLVRELLADSPEGFDWISEAQGAQRRMLIKSLERARRDRMARLSGTRESEANTLMLEIRAIGERLKKLSS
ncbi:MAG: hypothetical protein ABIU54_04005, partial [Candidatus Eisenbacteria bacterium]